MLRARNKSAVHKYRVNQQVYTICSPVTVSNFIRYNTYCGVVICTYISSNSIAIHINGSVIFAVVVCLFIFVCANKIVQKCVRRMPKLFIYDMANTCLALVHVLIAWCGPYDGGVHKSHTVKNE